MDQPDQPFLLADLWLIHDVRSATLDQPFHIVLDQLSRSAQLSRLNIPKIYILGSLITDPGSIAEIYHA